MTGRFIVEADGGSRGNPGPAAYGAVVRDPETGLILIEVAEHIGTTSNNVAEYRGLIAGLTAARTLDPDAVVEARLDSKLVVEQMSGRWQIKHPDMRTLAAEARRIAGTGGRVTYTWVPRERNKDADRLANEALDAAARGQAWQPRELAGAPRAAAAPTPIPELEAGDGSTRLLLVRHGSTALTEAQTFSGSGGSDPALSPKGAGEAKAAAEALAGRGPIDVLLSSPMRRTRQTAEIAGARLGLDVVIEDDLRELSFGVWEGLTFADIRERWPDELTAWLGSSSIAPEGGESLDEMRARIDAVTARLTERYAGQTLALVSHLTPISQFVCGALGAPAASAFRLRADPCSVSEVRWWPDGQSTVWALNDRNHLR